MPEGVGRRCYCRGSDGKDLGARCPKLKRSDHGKWYVQQELAKEGTKRNPFRRHGYDRKEDAEKDFNKVRALIALADDDDENMLAVTKILMALDRHEEIPDPEKVKPQLRARHILSSRMTVGDWLDTWIGQRQSKLRQGEGKDNTVLSYEGHVRNYLKPKIGHIRLDKLAVDDLIEMFNQIADDNDAIEAANEDRHAKAAETKLTRKHAQWRRIRAELKAMPPFRRPVGTSSQARILATLSIALSDAIAQQIPIINPAKHYSVGAKKPKPLIWTPGRVERWRRTGKRPGPVMVWTPDQAGEFMDYVHEHDPEFEALWHLFIHRGPRRGEAAGLDWSEADLDAGLIEIVTQRIEVNGVVVEDDPKSDAGVRSVTLEEEGVQLLRQLRTWQDARQLALGAAWNDSGKVFTYDDGTPLRPGWITKRFKKLYTAAGLPPIRLHDMRHTAATLMLAAKTDMKIIQETLGHSTLATTSDIYTSVLPQIAKEAADATVAIVPRKTSRTSPATPKPDHARITQAELSTAPPKRRITQRSRTRSTTEMETMEPITT